MPWQRDIHRQLTEAVDEGDLDTFRDLLEQSPENLRTRKGGPYWLNYAASHGLLEFIEFLAEKGLDIDEKNPNTEATPLRTAASEGHLPVVEWLLDHGARVNESREGREISFALRSAAIQGHLDVVKLLVERGADVHGEWNGMNALMQAELYGQQEVAEYLRSMGARDLRDTTPIDALASHDAIRRILSRQRGEMADWSITVPGDPPFAMHATRPSREWNSQTLFTVGMSDRYLDLPNAQLLATELMLTLPPDWPLTDAALADPNLNWPIEWLKRIARETLNAGTWPETDAVLFPEAGPPEPLGPNTQLCGWLCLLGESNVYQMPDHRWVSVRMLFPIFEDERRLVETAGHEELIRRFEERNLPLYVDPDRPNVAV